MTISSLHKVPVMLVPERQVIHILCESELVPLKIKCIGEGWDNQVFLVNNQFIFRFPHREVAAILIERENAVLKYMQNIVNLKIPNPIYVGKPSDDYPYHFHGYQIIKGKSGCHPKLGLPSRAASITILAEFLRRLHNITEAQALKIGAKNQVFDRIIVDKAIESLEERVEKINTRNVASINLTVFNEEMKIAKAIKLPITRVLVHVI